MNKEEIVKLALEASGGTVWWPIHKDALERFAALVAASEREACAKLCEEVEDEYREHESLKYAELKTDAETGASDCAYRIRARGN